MHELILMKLITITHFQIHLTLAAFSRSSVYRSRLQTTFYKNSLFRQSNSDSWFTIKYDLVITWCGWQNLRCCKLSCSRMYRVYHTSHCKTCCYWFQWLIRSCSRQLGLEAVGIILFMQLVGLIIC